MCFWEQGKTEEILRKEDMFLVKPIYSLIIPSSYSHLNIVFSA